MVDLISSSEPPIPDLSVALVSGISWKRHINVVREEVVGVVFGLDLSQFVQIAAESSSNPLAVVSIVRRANEVRIDRGVAASLLQHIIRLFGPGNMFGV